MALVANTFYNKIILWSSLTKF